MKSYLTTEQIIENKVEDLFYEYNVGAKPFLKWLGGKREQDNFFDEAYKDFNITRVDAKRSINSDPKKRTSIKEIVVTNY